MRNATILITNLRGTATEVIKNIVLAGVGRLILLDGEDVAPEDLGTGFFFRDEDVGTKVRDVLYGNNKTLTSFCAQRVDAAKARIESLNPLVTVETISSPEVLRNNTLEQLISTVDLVCVTDSDRDDLVRTKHLHSCWYAH
jgi:ubiquitin-like 1-activating enzyme E1 A